MIEGYKKKNYPNYNSIWWSYLEERGYHRRLIPDSCPMCYTLKRFVKERPADLDILFKLMDVVKDIKSTIKKIYEIEDMEGSDEYSGSYYADPMMDRRYPNRYSGNSYRGTYTVESGNGYSGRRMGRHYSRNTERDDLAMRLENMLTSTRSKEESDAIRKAIDILEA